ncbi:MAG: SDR family oxidoreductase [Gammaproteobacteria bacterium]
MLFTTHQPSALFTPDHAGKVAVVTGAGGGMGLQIARDLCAAGAAVTAIDLKPPPADWPDIAGSARYCQGDLVDFAFVAQTIADTFAAHGRLDYLVNAAGVLWFDRDRSFAEIDLGVWDQVLAINLKSMLHTSRAAVPWMQQTGGGAMVHISSVQALRGDDRPQDAYQASKAGMIALSKSIAVQYGRQRIRSNAILPGPTYTPMQARWDNDPAAVEALARRIPLGRVGVPQDIANACLFLLSDAAAFITGTELIVDGGVMALPY